MRIGILTFHNAHNYGAVLQAYALRTKLRKMGHDANILNYRNQKIEDSYQNKIRLRKLNISLLHPRIFLAWLDKYLDVKYAQQSWMHRVRVFNNFIDSILLDGKCEALQKSDLEEVDLDAIICGSDQIWTDYLTGGLDQIYFLDFNTRARKIAYGASKINAAFSEEQEMFFKKKLSVFYAISVREEKLAKKLSDVCQRKVETVLDPTMLLTQDDYQCLEEPVFIHEPYVLAYFLTEDEMLMKCAVELAKKTGAELIEIHYQKRRLKNHIQVVDCSPGEFLSYFRHAEHIITNSFHGVIFSIIYQKRFYAVYGQDDRKDELLRLLGLEQCHISDLSEMNLKCGIDYNLVNAMLKERRSKAENYLEKALWRAESGS